MTRKNKILNKFILIAFYLVLASAFLSCSNSALTQRVYLELNFDDSRINNRFAIKNQPLEIFTVIEKAANDDRVIGIILNIANISAERDHLWELRTALERFKSGGKKIVAYIGYADMDIYLLASVADRIVMHELGGLSITGYSLGRGFMKNTFEKLGIGVNELRYFEYKTAAESFSRDSFSAADRRQLNEYLDDVFNLSRSTLMQARNWTEQEFNNIINNEFLYSAKAAEEKGLVDYVGGFKEVELAIYKLEETNDNVFALYGRQETSLTASSLTYTPPRTQGGSPIIAIVYADGQTDMTRGMDAVRISRTIRSLANNSQIKAIVLRVNSPGGSAEAADYVNEAVRYAKIYKPVVVSMGSTAASGGYWVSMSANHIVANPFTITGSIGVIGTWFYDNGLNSKVGVNIETIKRGAHSDLNTGFIVPYRNLTPLEEERYKNYITDLYNIFTEKVLSSRYTKDIDINRAAQGRIFSGIRALEENLVDSIGGLTEAIQIARELADIPDEQNVQYRKFPELKFFEKLLESMNTSKSVFFGIDINPLFNSDLKYRLETNGQVMPILPLDFMIN